MDKQHILDTLKARIREQGVIENRYYIQREGKSCFCAIGHLMDICGVDMEGIRIQANSEPLVNIDQRFPHYMEPLYKAGFTLDELSKLQDVNDDWEDVHERVGKLTRHIDRVMVQQA